MSASIAVREVRDSDLEAFFEHQCEPAALRMAAFPTRAREPFMAHWARIRADPKVVARTVLFNGDVAGNVVSWEQESRRLVGYWIGQAYWGKGVATKAVAQFLAEYPPRPLFARVAQQNVASIRVLERNGFLLVGEERGVSIAGGAPADEFLYALGPSEGPRAAAPPRA